ncbi:coniferyl-aldehyde dehydrogenase [Pseudomonas sp. UC 17F4]|nr:coniferyl-aldehyde dehydrogenase [Pseudomonas sp. UC 17F4]
MDMNHSISSVADPAQVRPVSLSDQPQAPASALQAIFEQQTAAFLEQPMPSLEERLRALDDLEQLVRSHIPQIQAALDKDFGHRCEEETLMAEIVGSLKACTYAKRHLKRWMKRRRCAVDINFKPARAWVMPQPLGVVGVMSPWNYPFGLVIKPLIAALAAGNRVMIKPSEMAPAVGRLLQVMLAKAFKPSHVCVVEGDQQLARQFTELAFNHLLFTGSTSVGKQVMAAAAANLTPLTLELGGKSPVIIDEHFDMRRAVKSIVTGKLLNAGQTCTAPDYVMVPKARQAEFVEAFSAQVRHMYPDPLHSPDYTSIINSRHFERLQGYCDDAIGRGAQQHPVYPQQLSCAQSRRLLPTLLIDPPEDARIMQDEIFGPLLIVVPYEQLSSAVGYINQRPRPLALYVFTDDHNVEDYVLKSTVAGGVTINDTLLHYTQESLPFGGVGNSGFGAYHGERGFQAFSHFKPVFRQSRINFLDAVRAPYTSSSRWFLKKMIGMA